MVETNLVAVIELKSGTDVVLFSEVIKVLENSGYIVTQPYNNPERKPFNPLIWVLFKDA